MNRMLFLLGVCALLLCPATTVFADSCTVGKLTGNEHGTPTGDRVRAANVGILRGAGLTNVLKPFHDPGKCWNMTVFHAPRVGYKRYGLTEHDLCVAIDDYGIGSFDPLKHDYCKHNSYILQLHDESPNGFRLYTYQRVGHDLDVQLVAEFSKSGQKVPATIDLAQSPQAPTRTGGAQGAATSQAIDCTSSYLNINQRADCIKQGKNAMNARSATQGSPAPTRAPQGLDCSQLSGFMRVKCEAQSAVSAATK